MASFFYLKLATVSWYRNGEQCIHGSHPYTMCICKLDVVLGIHWGLWQVCVILAVRIQCRYKSRLQWRNVKYTPLFVDYILSLDMEGYALYAVMMGLRWLRGFLSIWLFVFYFLEQWSKLVFVSVKWRDRWWLWETIMADTDVIKTELLFVICCWSLKWFYFPQFKKRYKKSLDKHSFHFFRFVELSYIFKYIGAFNDNIILIGMKRVRLRDVGCSQ